jgi:REP element-mobilizing transposase RayT
VPAQPQASLEPDEDDSGPAEADTARLADLLAEMPAPNPNPAPLQNDWQQPAPAPSSAGFLFPWEVEQQHENNAATRATHLAENPPGVTAAPGPAASRAHTAATQAIPNLPAHNVATGDDEDLLDDTATNAAGEQVDTPAAAPTIAVSPTPRALNGVSADETQPVVLRTLQSLQQAEPVAPTFSNLAYTCVLVPRLPVHRLVEPFAGRMTEWLPQLCLAYGWRMAGMLVQPEYVQWTVQAAPAISPGNVVRLIRQQTSRRIFLQFPQLEVDNPSGDFWAPGYLIISGFQPPSAHLVYDFIRQTRQRQGAY